MRNSLLLFLVLIITQFAVAADPLPRRPQFGAQILQVTEEERQNSEVKFDGGILLGPVFPNTGAAEAGLEAGDILVSLGGHKLVGPGALGEIMKQIGANKATTVEIVRADELLTKPITLKTMPRDTSSEFDIIHDAVKVDGFWRRIVFTNPKGNGKVPLVVMMGGIGCYSLDPVAGGLLPYREILWQLTREGFATLRIEKTGMGDSEGPPCAEQNFWDEVHGYKEVLKHLNDFAFVDRNRVLYFGHSMGGIVAPVVAEEIPAAGIIALATSATEWTEYELTNLRRQRVLEGISYDSVDTEGKLKTRVMQRLIWEDKTPEEIIAEFPNAEAILGYPCHHTFIRDLGRLNAASYWMKYPGKVLFIYGTSDFITSADDHHYATDLVNKYHPGNATYEEIDDIDHFLLKQSDQKSSFDNMQAGLANREFNPAIIPVIVNWAKQVAALAGGQNGELKLDIAK